MPAPLYVGQRFNGDAEQFLAGFAASSRPLPQLLTVGIPNDGPTLDAAPCYILVLACFTNCKRELIRTTGSID